VEALTQWLSQPFKSDQSAIGWLMFVGLIVIALIFWGQVIKDFRSAV
jgi:hypothetical protein